MAKKLSTQYPPSFFQVLINPHFTRSLKVPIAFGRQYEEIMSTEKAKLRISSAGETWELKVEVLGDGFYHFTEGWEKFAVDLKLEKKDFLVFSFAGQSTFEVSAYGFDGCGKESFDSSYVLIEDSSDDDDDDDDDDEGARCDVADSSNPKFEIFLGKQHVSRVALRKNFAETAGLFGKKKVTLEHRPSGFRSEAVLDFRSPNMRMNSCGFRLDLSTGWRAFRKANRFTFGKTYSFEFVPSKGVIEVKEVIKMK